MIRSAKQGLPVAVWLSPHLTRASVFALLRGISKRHTKCGWSKRISFSGLGFNAGRMLMLRKKQQRAMGFFDFLIGQHGMISD